MEETVLVQRNIEFSSFSGLIPERSTGDSYILVGERLQLDFGRRSPMHRGQEHARDHVLSLPQDCFLINTERYGLNAEIRTQ